MSTQHDSLFQTAVPTIAASVVSGVVARIPLHPVDTLKSQVQAYSNSTSMLELLRHQNLRNLYSGFLPTVLVSIPGVTTYFGAYEASKSALERAFNTENSNLINFASGLAAETVSCVVWVPGDIIKERLQVQQIRSSNIHFQYRGAFDVLRDVYQKHGLLNGIYRGYGATILSFGPYSAFYLMFYEILKKKLCHWTKTEEANITLPISFCCGGVAGAIASWITSPLDLVKIRLQIQRAAAQNAAAVAASGVAASPDASPLSRQFRIEYTYRNSFDALQQIYRQTGVKGLFKGSCARMAFSAPAAALTVGLFDVIRSNIAKKLATTPPQSHTSAQ